MTFAMINVFVNGSIKFKLVKGLDTLAPPPPHRVLPSSQEACGAIVAVNGHRTPDTGSGACEPRIHLATYCRASGRLPLSAGP